MSGCDAAELFELAEEALDDVALLVEMGVVRALIFPVSLRWNDDCGLPLDNLVDEMIGVIAFVGNCPLCLKAVNELRLLPWLGVWSRHSLLTLQKTLMTRMASSESRTGRPELYRQ